MCCMDPQQQAFLAHIGSLIPKLFDAIRLGNVKSEYVLGDRIIGRRQVRLKLVAEVVDPGSNPLATHSQLRKGAAENAQMHHQPDTQAIKPIGPRRGPRRKHPMSKS